MKYFSDDCGDIEKANGKNCHESDWILKHDWSLAGKLDDFTSLCWSCMSSSFGLFKHEEFKTTFKDNTKLKAELDAQKEMRVENYPALYVNKEKYTVKVLQ